MTATLLADLAPDPPSSTLPIALVIGLVVVAVVVAVVVVVVSRRNRE